MKKYVIPIYIPDIEENNKGILYVRNIDKNNEKITKEYIKKSIEKNLNKPEKVNIEKELAFIGGNFNSINMEIQKEILEVACEELKEKKIQSIRVVARPEYINKEILKMYKKYKVKTIELDVQSTDNYILNRAGKSHTFEDIKKASKQIRWNGFKLGFQVVIGLPESTKLDELNVAKELVKLKPKGVKIYPALVIKDTKIEKEYINDTYEEIALVQAVERCKEVGYIFNNKKVKDIDILLHPLEEIEEFFVKEEDIIAGPYHNSFTQLVEANMWYDTIVNTIKKYNVKVKEVEIKINSVDNNSVIGYKKENINKLNKLYDVDLKIIKDDNIKQGKAEFKILKTYTDFLEEEKTKKKEKIKK